MLWVVPSVKVRLFRRVAPGVFMGKAAKGKASKARRAVNARLKIIAAFRRTKGKAADATPTKLGTKPLVGIIMGSISDWETMRHAAQLLAELNVPFEAQVVSAHRTPQRLYKYAAAAEAAGLRVIIAGAGGAAHLPGMTAAITKLPVLGVPVESKTLKGLDSLLSIAQMPAGIPVGTLAIGKAGAKNAALFAAAILALNDKALSKRLGFWRSAQTESVSKKPA